MQNSNGPNTTSYLFQAAIGRSGSTILRRSIGLHPDVYYNGKENNLIQDIAEVAHRNCTQHSRVVAMEVDQPTYNAAFGNLICSLVWPDQELCKRPVHFAAINPTESNLDYLGEMFPEFKLVCLVRNGIEVVCSRLKFDSFSHLDFRSHCQTWMRIEQMLEWGEKNPDRFFLFRHEWTYEPKLIESKIDEMFRWAGMRSSQAVIDNILNVNDCMPTTQAPKEFVQMTERERRDYFRAKGERWRSWKAEERNDFVEICGGLMKRLGYPIPFEGSAIQTRAA